MIVEYTRYKIEEARREAFEKDYAQAAKFLQASTRWQTWSRRAFES